MLFLQLLINGIQVGAFYALIAAGFSLIFGSTKVFHFAHGAAFILASYVFYWLFVTLGSGWVLSIAGAMLAAIGFGVFMDRLVYAPIQRHESSFFTVFVASLGMAIIVQNVIALVFGSDYVTVATPLAQGIQVTPGLFVSPLAAIAVLSALVFFGVLQLIMQRTHFGMALRALAENTELIRVYGLSARRLSTIAFILGSLLVVPGAVLTAASTGLNPAMGEHVMLISLAATIVGGVGSLKGAAYAGMLLGIAENLALLYLGPEWSGAISFAILFIFILFRPAGFFGHTVVS